MAKSLREAWPKPEAPKLERPVHRFETAIGFCPTCNRIEAREPEKLMARIPEIKKFLIDQGYVYACDHCNMPLAKTPEEAKALPPTCPWCGIGKYLKRVR
jgi:rubrerythrin